MTKNKFHFFLGGQDLEMTEISKLLDDNGQTYDDAKLQWGASAETYERRIKDVAAAGQIPVLVELEENIPLPKGTLSVDHHGSRAQEPASILQIADILNIELTRDQELVAANDSGYINGMRAAGATPEEIKDIRSRDRAAQGITQEQENQAQDAIQTQMEYNSPDTLAVVRCPHSKVASIMDHYRGQPDGGPKGILVLSEDGEVNYSGPGHIAEKLSQYFPENSWSGGSGLGKEDGEAFFGMNAGQQSVAVHAAAVAFTALDERDAKGTHNKHGRTANFLGLDPWVDRENADRSTPFEGGFYAVQLANESNSTVPARIWHENGGSFQSFLRHTPEDHTKASKGLDYSKDEDFDIEFERLQKLGMDPLKYAKSLNVSPEVMSEIKKGVVRQKAAESLPVTDNTDTPQNLHPKKSKQEER
jgi:hypothetical protein